MSTRPRVVCMKMVEGGSRERGGEWRRGEERGSREERRGKGRTGQARRRVEERIRKDEVPNSGDSYRVSLGTHTCPLLAMSRETAETAETAQAGRTAGRALPLYTSQEIA